MMGVLKTVVRFVMQAVSKIYKYLVISLLELILIMSRLYVTQKMNAVLDKFIEKESIELPIDGMFINN